MEDAGNVFNTFHLGDENLEDFSKKRRTIPESCGSIRIA